VSAFGVQDCRTCFARARAFGPATLRVEYYCSLVAVKSRRLRFRACA
jgi:hypothetical protein